jgi:hypothetical protein
MSFNVTSLPLFDLNFVNNCTVVTDYFVLGIIPIHSGKTAGIQLFNQDYHESPTISDIIEYIRQLKNATS